MLNELIDTLNIKKYTKCVVSSFRNLTLFISKSQHYKDIAVIPMIY